MAKADCGILRGVFLHITEREMGEGESGASDSNRLALGRGAGGANSPLAHAKAATAVGRKASAQEL